MKLSTDKGIHLDFQVPCRIGTAEYPKNPCKYIGSKIFDEPCRTCSVSNDFEGYSPSKDIIFSTKHFSFSDMLRSTEGNENDRTT